MLGRSFECCRLRLVMSFECCRLRLVMSFECCRLRLVMSFECCRLRLVMSFADSAFKELRWLGLGCGTSAVLRLGAFCVFCASLRSAMFLAESARAHGKADCDGSTFSASSGTRRALGVAVGGGAGGSLPLRLSAMRIFRGLQELDGEGLIRGLLL